VPDDRKSRARLVARPGEFVNLSDSRAVDEAVRRGALVREPEGTVRVPTVTELRARSR